jgi:threonine synthase
MDGLITDCGAEVGRRKKQKAGSTSHLKEPYRVEGKKPLGYEVAEQLELGTTLT